MIKLDSFYEEQYSEKLLLAIPADEETSRFIIEDRTAVEGRRDRFLMRDECVEIRFRRQPRFDCAHETIQATEAIELFSISNPGSVE